MGTHWSHTAQPAPAPARHVSFFAILCDHCRTQIGYGTAALRAVCMPCYRAGMYPDPAVREPEPATMCRHCGREPEAPGLEMCASCNLREQLDAEAYCAFAEETFVTGVEP